MRGVEVGQGLATRALRGHAVIDHGRVSLRGSDIEEYTFVAEPDFLFDLTAIRSERGVVRFVAEYGFLFEARDAEDDEIPEFLKGGPLVYYWESLDDWFELTSRLQTLERLYDHSQRIASVRDRYSIQTIRNMVAELELPVPGSGGVSDTELEFASEEARLVWQASLHIASTLTTELEQNDARFLVSLSLTPPRFALLPASRTLAGHAWLQLASVILQGLDLTSCQECGRTLIADDPRRRYCSDRCGTRVRQRRFRAKRQKPSSS